MILESAAGDLHRMTQLWSHFLTRRESQNAAYSDNLHVLIVNSYLVVADVMFITLRKNMKVGLARINHLLLQRFAPVGQLLLPFVLL